MRARILLLLVPSREEQDRRAPEDPLVGVPLGAQVPRDPRLPMERQVGPAPPDRGEQRVPQALRDQQALLALSCRGQQVQLEVWPLLALPGPPVRLGRADSQGPRVLRDLWPLLALPGPREYRDRLESPEGRAPQDRLSSDGWEPQVRLAPRGLAGPLGPRGRSEHRDLREARKGLQVRRDTAGSQALSVHVERLARQG